MPKLKPLVFSSYNELKTRSKMDYSSVNNLKRMDIQKCYKHFIEIEREARMSREDGDEERAYILYSRAMEIYRLMNDKIAIDPTFRRSKDGYSFYKTSERMLVDIEEVINSLKMRFGRDSSPHSEANTKSEEPEIKAANFLSETHAKPKEIVCYVEQGNAALVLDYRTNQIQSLEYKGKNGSMKVVHIEKDIIMLGSLLHSIIKALDISVRPILENISHFDIVFLLGDLEDISKKKGTKTRILYEALTTYNTSNKLRNLPLIMEGGFENWTNSYPYYVAEKCDLPKFAKSFDEQFSTWIEESRTANQLNIQYPDLTGFSGASKPSELSKKTNNLPYKDSNRVADKLYPLEAIKQRLEPAPTLPISDTPTYSSYGDEIHHPDAETSVKEVEIANTTKIPQIDRSKKPNSTVNYPSVGKREGDLHSVKMNNNYDKENMAPPCVANRSALPQVLGGARVADAPPESPPIMGASTAPPHQPPRPPTPDRSTKTNLLNKQQQHPQQQSDSYFKNSYLMAKSRTIEDSISKQAKTKPGYTGLINMGNTCFMNATLQALFHTPEFSQLFRNQKVASCINSNNNLGTKGIISGCFSALLDLIWSGEFSAIRPYFFLHMFAQRVNSALADRQQHDAQEFQIYLLDALHEDTNKVDKRRPFEQNYDTSDLAASAKDFFKLSRHFSSSPVNDIFNLTTVSILECKNCKATSVRFEGLNQISIELSNHGKPLKLKDCLSAHFSSTVLDALWDCPRCKTKQSATRCTKIWSFPKILIIHMKRFSLCAGHFIKNEAEVAFDINDFDLSPYIHEKAPEYHAHYNLYAITNHSGNLNSGHYTSYVRNLASDEREWLHFDDERCTRSNTPSYSSKQAFLLYYQQR